MSAGRQPCTVGSLSQEWHDARRAGARPRLWVLSDGDYAQLAADLENLMLFPDPKRGRQPCPMFHGTPMIALVGYTGTRLLCDSPHETPRETKR